MGAIWAGTLLVAYLAATMLLLVAGHARVGWPTVALHGVLLASVTGVTLSPGVPAWLRAWTPVLVLLLLYMELPALIQAAGHRSLFDPLVATWEQFLFHGQPARAWARRWPQRWLGETLHAAYLSYYAIIASVPAVLYASGRRRAFDAATFVLMVTFVLCFTCYLVFPVAGPRYVWGPAEAGEIASGPIRSATLWLLEARSSKGTAFPSSHVAVSVTQTIVATRYLGRRQGGVLGLLTLGLALGAIYGGFHYAIDVVIGALAGSAAAAAALALVPRLERARQANASAPT